MVNDNEFLKFISSMNNEELENYKKYSKVRSKELYYYLSKFLKSFYNELQVEYEMVNQWIRFDKDVKNVLYRFYATFEEYFKTTILEKTTVIENNKEFIERESIDKCFPNKDLMKILNVNYQKTFENKNILNFFNNKKFSNLNLPFNKEEIKKINNLRNKIMHLSFILLPIYDDEFDNKKLKGYLTKINNQIKILIKNLPSPWDKYLKYELKNTLKYKEKETKKLLDRNLDLKLLLDVFK